MQALECGDLADADEDIGRKLFAVFDAEISELQLGQLSDAFGSDVDFLAARRGEIDTQLGQLREMLDDMGEMRVIRGKWRVIEG